MEGHRRPVELTVGLLLLVGLGVCIGFAGMFVMADSLRSAFATMSGVLVAALAAGALFGSGGARATLIVLLGPLIVLVAAQRIGWLAVALALAVVLLVGSPRARAWYR